MRLSLGGLPPCGFVSHAQGAPRTPFVSHSETPPRCVRLAIVAATSAALRAGGTGAVSEPGGGSGGGGGSSGGGGGSSGGGGGGGDSSSAVLDAVLDAINFILERAVALPWPLVLVELARQRDPLTISRHLRQQLERTATPEGSQVPSGPSRFLPIPSDFFDRRGGTRQYHQISSDSFRQPPFPSRLLLIPSMRPRARRRGGTI